LSENDIIVEKLRINYAMKDQNPVDHIKFYSKYNGNESFTIEKSVVSHLVPDQFEETVVRVYTRDTTKTKAIQDAFRSLMKAQIPP